MKTKISSTKWCSAPSTLKRCLMAAAFPLLALASHAQLNIGSTAAPNSSAALQVNSGSNRGLLFPRVALTGTTNAAPLSAHVKGMTVYNTATVSDVLPGFYTNDGTKWVNIVTSSPSSPSTASTGGSPLGVNVGSILAPDASAALQVNSGGNKGLLLPLVSLTGSTNAAPLAGGSHIQGMAVYNLATVSDVCPGTYVDNGSQWIRLEGACAVTPPAPGVVPSTVTLAQNQRYWIASVYDNNYLPYTAPTTSAILPGTSVDNASNPSTSPTTVDYQGTLTTTGVTVTIPVTVTGSATLSAWSNTVTIPAEYTQDGNSRQITLSWASQAVTTSTKTITATIQSVGGSLLPKQLDINSGIGNDYLGFLLGAFQYPYNNTGTLTNYDVRDIPGIPDRMFGVADNNGLATTHMMLYLPVQAEDGKIWLNNNLGAHYTNLNNSGFNLVQQATGALDYLAFGSLFQWGRKPDGHELITYTNSTGPGVPVNGATQTASDNPTNALFIYNSSSDLNWWVTPTSSPTFWASATSPNNPCPSGFRVPTSAEYTNLISKAGISGFATAASSILKLTSGFPNVGGWRQYQTGDVVGSGNYYYTSSYQYTSGNVYPSVLSVNTSSVTISNTWAPANGMRVRCIQQ